MGGVSQGVPLDSRLSPSIVIVLQKAYDVAYRSQVPARTPDRIGCRYSPRGITAGTKYADLF